MAIWMAMQPNHWPADWRFSSACSLAGPRVVSLIASLGQKKGRKASPRYLAENRPSESNRYCAGSLSDFRLNCRDQGFRSQHAGLSPSGLVDRGRPTMPNGRVQPTW
jgi:hypothetical protein